MPRLLVSQTTGLCRHETQHGCQDGPGVRTKNVGGAVHNDLVNVA